MALSRHIQRYFKKIDPQPTVRNLDVEAAAVIYNGAIISLNATGEAAPADPARGEFFMGIARDGYDNTGGAATTGHELIVETGHIERMKFNGAITDADIGKKVWYVDDEFVTLTDPVTIAQAQVGVLVAVEATPLGWVDLSKAVS
jgi:hypothetical protein